MLQTDGGTGSRRLLKMPEVTIVIFAFLLNFIWEFLQIPFFQNMMQIPHWQGVRLCATAALGDAFIMLVAFWSVALITRTRHWFLMSRSIDLTAFIAVGVAIAVGIEIFALNTGRWAYSEAMPIVPLLKVGLIPILAWVFLPPLTIWFVSRQLN